MVKKINKSLRILSTTKRSKERNKFLKSNQIFKEIWRKKKGKKNQRKWTTTATTTKNQQKNHFWVFLSIDDSYCVVSLACTFRCSSDLATDRSWVLIIWFDCFISLLLLLLLFRLWFVFRVVLVLSRIFLPKLWFLFSFCWSLINHFPPPSTHLSLSLYLCASCLYFVGSYFVLLLFSPSLPLFLLVYLVFVLFSEAQSNSVNCRK